MNPALGKLRCRIFGHKRLGFKVWHDGVDYRAPCAYCGHPLVRDMHGEWREFDWQKDAPPGSQPRGARPHRDDVANPASDG